MDQVFWIIILRLLLVSLLRHQITNCLYLMISNNIIVIINYTSLLFDDLFSSHVRLSGCEAMSNNPEQWTVTNEFGVM